MKVTRFVLKAIALGLAIAAAVCAVIAFWDSIQEGVGCIANKVRCRRQLSEGCIEDEEYADWDE